MGEHEALGDLYNNIFSVKDEIVEKIMGYLGTRTKAMPTDPVDVWVWWKQRDLGWLHYGSA